MKKSLLFLLIAFISCTDNSQKVTQSTTSTPVETVEVVSEVLETEFIPPSENIVLDPTDPHTAILDKGLDLVKISGSGSFKTNINGIETLHPDMCWYKSHYYDPMEQTYYWTTIQPTNGLIYNFPEKHVERVWNDIVRIDTTNFVYVGSLSPTERLYINKHTKEQWLYTLHPIKTDTTMYPAHIRWTEGILASMNFVTVTNANGEFFELLTEQITNLYIDESQLKYLQRELEANTYPLIL